MRIPYIIIGILLIMFALFVAVESLQMKYYTSLGPGPGFFSFWLSIVLAVLAGAMLFSAIFQRSGPMAKDFFAPKSGYIRILSIIGAWIGAVLLTEILGFRLTMLGFMSFLLFALGRNRWFVVFAISFAMSFGTYHVFVHWFDVTLPTGILGF